MSNFTTWRSLVDGEEIVAIPDSGADHYYPVTAGSGPTIEDVNGNVDLTDYNGSWVSGEGIGEVYADLDGVDNMADTARSNATWGNQTLTVTVWTKPASTTDRLLSSNVDGDTIAWDFRDGGETFQLNDGSTGGGNISLSGSFSVNTNDWNFLAGTVNISTNEASFYAADVNDTNTTEVDNTSDYGDGNNRFDDADHLTLGASNDPPGDFFEGGVDAIQYFAGEEKSKSDIDAWFNDTKEFYS